MNHPVKHSRTFAPEAADHPPPPRQRPAADSPKSLRTRARILANTLTALAAAGRLRPDRAWVAFGPCLRAESLAVGPEVARTFDPRFVRMRDGKTYFDMPADNRDQALACGIAPERIRDLGGDTLREPERFFSYRRDGAASGRLAAFIALR